MFQRAQISSSTTAHTIQAHIFIAYYSSVIKNSTMQNKFYTKIEHNYFKNWM